jgi:hypothetical protein
MVCNEEQPDAALDTFMKLLFPVTNKHTTMKKMTVETVKSPWIDEEFKHFMVERDEAKGMAIQFGSPTDWQTYCKLINHVTKLNKNKLFYETKINSIKNSIKKCWGKKPSFIESDGSFFTKPTDIAKYFNDFFIGKIS